MKALLIAGVALVAMTAAASAQPTQLTAAAMDHVVAGGLGISISIPCPNFTPPQTAIPCPNFTPPPISIPCPIFFGLRAG